jgi:arabinogalactan oligomer/maltooligosaccharide transport system permease protein
MSKKTEMPTLPPQAKRHLGIKAANAISNAFIYVLLVLITIIWLVPFVFIVLQSFEVGRTGMSGDVIPSQWGLDNYIKLFAPNSSYLKWYGNTFIIALCTAAGQTIIQFCMSYTLSRFRFKMRKPLMQFMLILGMFPGMLGMIILYNVLKMLGMTNGNAVPGLILVNIASSGMGYYVSKGFLDTIPKSLDEAARIDGATRLQILQRVILPLAKPIVIYTVLTAFMGPWGDFVFASYIAMGTNAGMNVAVGLNSWLTADQIPYMYTQFCAGGVLVALPVTILFMCLQKYYVEGVTGGAVKG